MTWKVVYENCRTAIARCTSQSNQEDKFRLLKDCQQHLQQLHSFIDLAIKDENKEKLFTNGHNRELFRDLLQLLFLIFNQYLPIIDTQQNNSIPEPVRDKKLKYIPPPMLRRIEEQDNSAFRNSQYKFSLLLLAQLSALDAVSTVPCLSIFLSDSFKVERLLQEQKNKILNVICDTQGDTLSINLENIPFQSKVFFEIMNGISMEEKLIAIDSVKGLLCRINLFRYISIGKKTTVGLSNLGQKVAKYLLKVFNFILVVVYKCDEDDTSFLEKVLELFKNLVITCSNNNKATNERVLYEPLTIAQEECWRVIFFLSHTASFPPRYKVSTILKWLQYNIKDMFSHNKDIMKMALHTLSSSPNKNYLSYLFRLSTQSFEKGSRHSPTNDGAMVLLGAFINNLPNYLQSNAFSTNLVNEIRSILDLACNSKIEQQRDFSCTVLMVLLSVHNMPDNAERYGIVVFSAVQQLMHDNKHLVRVKCIEILAKSSPAALKLRVGSKSLLTFAMELLLSDGTGDEIGTVREAAYRSIGELLQTIILSDHSNTATLSIPVQTFLTGIRDKKLSVRVQATWSLSKYLHLARKIGIRNNVLLADWQIENLITLLSCLETSISDSDKLLTTNILCIGFTALTLIDIFSTNNGSVHVDPFLTLTCTRATEIYHKLQIKILGNSVCNESMSESIHDSFIDMNTLLENFAQKVICSHCQTSVALLQLLIQLKQTEDTRLSASIIELFQVFTHYLRFGFLQLQVLAASSMLQLFKLYNNEHITTMPMLLDIVERCFVVTDNNIDSIIAIRKEANNKSREVGLTYKESKIDLQTKRLQSLSILLLRLIHHLIMTLASQPNSNISSKLLEMFSYHAESLTTFLEIHTSAPYEREIAEATEFGNNYCNVTDEKPCSICAEEIASVMREIISAESSSVSSCYSSVNQILPPIIQFRLHNLTSTTHPQLEDDLRYVDQGSYSLFDGLDTNSYLNSINKTVNLEENVVDSALNDQNMDDEI